MHLATLNQLQTSEEVLQQHEKAVYSPVFRAEVKVVPFKEWDPDIVHEAIADIDTLLEIGEHDRARGAFLRWFDQLSVGTLGRQLYKDIAASADDDEPVVGSTNQPISSLGKRLGEFFAIFGGRFVSETAKTPLEKSFAASFGSGIVIGLSNRSSDYKWVRALKYTSGYWADIELTLRKLYEQKKWRKIALALRALPSYSKNCPSMIKISLGVLAILTNDHKSIAVWTDVVRSNWYKLLRKSLKDNFSDTCYIVGRMSFLLGWSYVERDAEWIARKVLSTYYEDHQKSSRGNKDNHIYQSVYCASLIGRAFRKLFDGNHHAAERLVPVRDFEVAIRLINSEQSDVDFRVYFLPYFKEILPGLIYLGEHLSGAYDDVVQEELVAYATSRKTGHFLGVVWNTLFASGHLEELERWAQHWIGDKGKVWEMGFEERHEIVEKFSDLLENSGLPELANKAKERYRWTIIGYSSHKDYSLSTAVDWFSAVGERSPGIWEIEGLKLLSLSRHLERVGADNRYEHQVQAAVFKMACLDGPKSMMRLWSSLQQWHYSSIIPIPSGLIGMLQEAELTRDDLLAMWAIGTGLSPWETDRGQQISSDLRSAIVAASARLGQDDPSDIMRQLAPAEFCATGGSDRYSQPFNWFSPVDTPSTEGVEDLAEITLSESLIQIKTELEEPISGLESRPWKRLGFVLERIASEGKPSGFGGYLNELLELITQQSHEFPWHFDGRERTIKLLFGILSENQRWRFLQNLLSAQNIPLERHPFLYSAHLDSLCFYNAEIVGGSLILEGCDNTLNMHHQWATGCGYLPPVSIPKTHLLDSTADSWAEFGVQLFTQLLDSQDTLELKSGMRGMTRIILNQPETIDVALTACDGITERAMEQFLFLTEAWCLNLTVAESLIPFLTGQLGSDNINIALQAWVTLRIIDKVHGLDVPEWQERIGHKSEERIHVVWQERLLHSPPMKLGRYQFISGSRGIRAILRQLSEVVGEPLLDIEVELAESSAEVKESTSSNNTINAYAISSARVIGFATKHAVSNREVSVGSHERRLNR